MPPTRRNRKRAKCNFLQCTLLVSPVPPVLGEVKHNLKKSARFARTFSSRASLARMSAPRARDLMVVALRAPTYMTSRYPLSVACFIALSILV